MIKSMGGAMDLVAGAKRVLVTMDHVSRSGEPKIRRACTLPLTGLDCVDMIVTDLCMLRREGAGRRFVLLECAPGVTVEEILAKTEAAIVVPDA